MFSAFGLDFRVILFYRTLEEWLSPDSDRVAKRGTHTKERKKNVWQYHAGFYCHLLL